jgi:hypothetical protein
MYKSRLWQIFVLVVLVASIPVGVFLVDKAVIFFTRASGTSANLVIDTSASYEPSPDVWRSLAQGGEEKGRMLLPVVDKVRPMGIQYVRLDHVLDGYDVVTKDGSGQLAFNWTKLDETITDIRSMGATPFISLSYMPPAISKSGKPEDLPANWSDWELVVQRTIEHISGKGGLAIPNVYYEVWNEPDLFGGFKHYGEKNYLELYSHSAMGASRATNTNPYKFGGPATTGMYSAWLEALMKLADSTGMRLDFVSWHRYSKDLDDYEKDVAQAKAVAVSYPKYADIEMHITEVGPNSNNDPVYDNYFSTIHTLATATMLQDEVTRVFNFEIKDGPNDKQYWGRWGLFTHEKHGEPIAKPRVSAFNFLSRMRGRRLNIAGEGSWVKAFGRQNGENVSVMVVNYDQAGKHTEAVPIKFIGLKNQNFIFKRSDFSGKKTENKVATSSAEWSTLELMEANSASIFEIIPVQ